MYSSALKQLNLYLLIFIVGCGSKDKLNTFKDQQSVPQASISLSNSVISIVSGDAQYGPPERAFAEPLKVAVKDLSGSPMPDIPITFSLEDANSATLNPSTASTDKSGTASSICTPLVKSGVLNVKANVTDQNGVTFALHVTDQSDSKITLISGANQSATPSAALAEQIVLQASALSTNAPVQGIIVHGSVTENNGYFIDNKLLADFISDANGLVKIDFTVGSQAGQNTINLQTDAGTSSAVQVTENTVVDSSTTPDLEKSTVTASPTSFLSDGVSVSTLTLTAEDRFGNVIPGGGGTVEFLPSDGTLLGGVTDNGDGTYTQQLRAPSTRNGTAVSVHATINGSQLTSPSALITLLAGTLDRTVSTITATPATVTADGLSSSLITVQLKDFLGNILGRGGNTVTISTTAGTLVGSVVDNNDGTYSMLLRSPTSITAATVSASVDGQALSNTVSVSFVAGPVDLQKSTVTSASSSLLADGQTTTAITVTLRDANNNQLTTGGKTVVINATAGTLVGSVQDNNNGTYSQVLKAPSSRGSGSISVSATVNAASLTSSPAVISLHSGVADSGLSTITANPTAVTADGSSVSLITVTLKDTSGNQLSGGGNAVSISTTAGTVLNSVQDNNDGTYTISISAPITATTATVSAVVDGQGLTHTATLQFKQGAANPTQSTISLSTNVLKADGLSTVTITAVLKDINGNLLTQGGDTVVFTATAGTLQGTVTDNNNGTYTQVLKAPSSRGTGTISVSGTLNGTAFTSGTKNISLYSSNIDVTKSTVAVSPAAITADGVSFTTVTVALKDSSNATLSSGGETVVISTTAGTLSGGNVTDNNNGTYTQTLVAPSSVGTATVSATVGGAAIISTASLQFKVGPPDVVHSTVTTSSPSLVANGSSTLTVTVTLKDALGRQLTAGGATVVISATAGTLLGAVTDNNNGTYTQSLQAPSSRGSGTLSLSATVNTAAITSTLPTISLLSGSIDLTMSAISSSQSNLTANGAATATITVSLKDSVGNILGTGGDAVIIYSTSGTLLGSVSDNGNGTYSQTLRAPTTTGSTTLSATAGGSSLTHNITVSFVPGPFDATKSTVTASPTSLVADGISVSAITVTLRDANSNQLSGGGQTVTLSATLGSWLGAGVTDNGDATYTRTLKAPADKGTGSSIVTATVNGTALAAGATITLTNGSVDLNQSTVSVLPSSLTADGSSTATITVGLKNSLGNLLGVGGDTVTITTTAGTLIGTVTDNGNGTYSQAIKAPALAGTATISAKDGGQSITNTASLPFIPGPPSLSASTVTTSVGSLFADGVSTAVLTLTVRDSNNNQMQAGGLTVAFTPSAGTLISTPVDHGNGTYTQTLRVPSSVGSGSIGISATISSSALTSTAASITLHPGSIDLGQSTVSVSPTSLTADGSSTATITVALKDSLGNSVGIGGSTVVIFATAGNLIASVTDLGNGNYTQMIRAPTVSGTSSISATVAAQPVVQTASLTFNPGPANAARSIISSSVSSLKADGASTSTITVILKDINGNQLTQGGASVVISASAGTLLSSIVDHANGSYTQLLQAPSSRGSGSILVSATENSTSISSGNPTVTLLSANIDLTKSLVTASPAAITADGISSTTITVTLKDSSNTTLSSGGETVVISTSAGTLQGNVTDNSNGTYTQVLKSSTSLTTATVSATVGGSAIISSASVQFQIGPPDVTKSIISSSSGNLMADGNSTLTLTVSLKDSQNRQLTVGGATVVISATAGNLIGSVQDNINGTYTQVLKAPATRGSGSLTATATVNTVALTTTPVTITLSHGTIDVTRSTVTTTVGSLAADGVSTTTITVSLLDGSGNSIGQGGDSVSISTTAGTLVATVADNGNGTYTQTIRAPAILGSATISATVGASSITHTATLNFINGALSLSNSTISVLPTTLTADGVSTATVTVTLRDVNNNQMNSGGATVVISPTTGTLVGTVADHSNGTYTQTLTAPTSIGSGSLSLTATANTQALTSGAATVTLSSGSVDLTRSSITASPSGITADGISTSTITVMLKDGLGNQIGSGGASVVITPSTGTLIGSIVDNHNGTYTQTIRSTTVAGAVTLSATVNSSPVTNNGNLIFNPGAANLTKSLITVSPSTLPPNGVSTSLVTVVLKDSNNNALTSSGGTVVISSTAGSWSGATTDNNNGTYQRTLVAAATAATAVISATVNGSSLSKTVNVYMNSGGGPSVINSLVSISANMGPADGSSIFTITVTLKDSSNNQIASGGSTVIISSTAGTLLGSATDNGNGTYQQNVRAPASSAVATISATADGNALVNTAGISFYGSISLANSTIVSIPPSTVADGASTSMILLQAKDSSGISTPVGGVTGISFAATAGTLQASVVDNSNGTYTQSLKAPASSATATVTASIGGSGFTNSTSVVFYSQTNLAGLTIDCANIATYQNGNIYVSSGTLTMNSTGANGTCPASFVFQSVTLKNNGVITTTATTTSQEYGLEFSSGNVSIDSTSKIDVSGKGYPGHTTAGKFYVQGNQLVLNKNSTTSSGAGGTYGGEGGSEDATDYPSKPYGNIFAPIDLGASGGQCSGGNANATGAGGGRVKITVTGGGTLTNNGSILANGAVAANASACLGGGAGGSVYITTGTINGTGIISANGSSLNGSNAAGGGGRIAIYYTTAADNFSFPTNVIANVNAFGGQGGNGATSDGAAGTIYLKSSSQTYGDMIVNNGNRTNDSMARTYFNVPATMNPDAITGTVVTKASTFSDTYSTTKFPYVNFYVNPNIAQNATTTLSDDTVFKIGSSDANSITVASGNMLSVNPTPSTSTQFRLMLIFDDMEIAGKASVSGNAPILVYNGDLSSGDTITASIKGYPPSGLEYFGANVTVDATTSYGTFTPSTYSGTLTLSNGTFALTNVTLKGLTLNNATVTATCLKGTTCLNINGGLSLANGSTLYQAATTSINEYSLEIVASSLTVSAGTTISAVGTGYNAPNTSYFTTYGDVQTGGMNGVRNVVAGGSHGGNGGWNSLANDSNATYGSITNPYESGASGENYNGDGVSGGGGIIKINLGAGAASIDGTIDASGGTTGGNWVNAGAGGSVYLNFGSITGAGLIKANGGSTTTSNAGGGGGGRIALYYITPSGGFAYPAGMLGRIQAYGGVVSGGNAKNNGAAGTIYLKSNSQTYGDLVVNNNNTSTDPSVATNINFPAQAASTALTATVLTRSGAFSELGGYNTNYLAGYQINPNIAQNATATMTDDTMFTITSQTTDAVTITTGDMTSIGAVTNTYRAALVLDHLDVQGGARINTAGKILVKIGDVTSNSAGTFSFNGSIAGAGTVEVQNGSSVTLANGTFNMPDGINVTALTVSAATLTATNGITVSSPLTITNSTITTSTISGNALTLNNSTLTIGCLKGTTCINLSGALTLQNGATITQVATTLSTEYALDISTTGLTMASGTLINAVGMGYVEPVASQYFTTYGNIAVLPLSGALNTNCGGGSHGGRGGTNNGANDTDATYGSITQPYESGSSYKSNCGSGSGGGIIKINLSGGAASIDGTIDASANSTNQGGAGGSVWINAGSVTGAGTLKANGTSYGAGGRIALYYTGASGGFTYPASILSRVQAFGGVGANGGAAGTIYLKSNSQTYGDLVINNNNYTTSAGTTTYINAPASAASNGLTSTTLTLNNAFGENTLNTNYLLGYYVNPNTAQNATLTMNDDTMFPITSQTINSVTVGSGDMTTIASSGNNFWTVLVLDHLDIQGAGRLQTAGRILVKTGDVTSGTAGVINYNGSIFGTTGVGFPEFYNMSSVTLTNGTYFLQNGITGGSLTLNNATVSVGCPLGTTCLNLTGSLSLQNSSTLSQVPTTLTAEYALDVAAAGGLTVPSGSMITAAVAGYAPPITSNYYTTYGNVALPYNSSAGSHGGKGGGAGNFTYGSITNPYESGASGSNSCGGGVPGGGIIKINLSGATASIDGTIDATGGSNACYNGAGGSVFLQNVGTITGAGLIKANGGASTNNLSGGGGRIALYYTNATGGFSYPTNMLLRFQAYGGAGTNSTNGAAGTIYFKSNTQTYGDLVINNNNLTTGATTTTYINSPTPAASTALTSTTLTKAAAFGENGLNSNYLLGYSINPNIAQNSTATLTDDTMFLITGQTLNSVTVSSGDMTTVGSVGNTFRAVLVLDRLDVQGGARVENAGKMLVKLGDVTSNSSGVASYNGPIAGAGTFEMQNTSSVTLANGTFNMPDGFNGGALTINNSTVNVSNGITASNVTINGSTVTVGCVKGTTCINLSGALNLQSGATIVQIATTLSTEYAVDISAASLTVASGGLINAAGLGYVTPSTANYFTSYGNVPVLGINSSVNTNCAGGSHGGRGGFNSSSSDVDATYGSIMQPYESGSSGKSVCWWGIGGGIVKINLNGGSAQIDGMIDASASSTSTSGAGGSVWINAGSVTGAGTLKANGTGAGGGGRIALYYTSTSGGFTYPTNILARFQAYGGPGAGNANAAAGTIYLKGSSQTYGDLAVNNNNLATNAAITTYINAPPSAASTGLTSTTLTLANAFGENGLNTNYLYGYYMNPNTAQNSTLTMNDDTMFPITAQTLNTVGIGSGDMTTVASSGNNFWTVLVLDHLDIQGGARLQTAGRILVKTGDVTSGTAGVVSYNGNISGPGFPELYNMTSVTLANGSYNLQNGMTGGALTINNATVTVGCPKGTTCVNLSGNLLLQNSSTLNQTPTTSTAEYGLDIAAAGLTVPSGSTITSASLGYAPPVTNGYYTTYGNIAVASGSSGGQHGGKAQAGNPTYGSITNPYESGASGVVGSAAPGGGIIKINLGGGTASIDGTIDSTGGGCPGCYSNNGAGGSVYLNVGTITGAGTIKANGGTSGVSYNAGAGGRIALYYTTASGSFTYPTNMLARLQAFGGIGNGANANGAAGTIYLKSSAQTYGDLVINNNGISTNATYTTYINFPAVTTSTTLTSTTLTRSNAFSENTYNTNYLLGYYMNPNIAQNSTPTLSDDTMFAITSQDVNSVSISTGDMTTVGASGNTYRAVLVLDNLDVTNLARLETAGSMLVKTGDVSDKPADIFNISGYITGAGTVELDGETAITYNAQGGTLSMTSLSIPGSATLTNGTFNIPTITAGGNLTIDSGATVVAGTTDKNINVNVTGNLNITNGSVLKSASTTSSAEYRLYVSANNLTIDSSSSIIADATGYVEQVIGLSRSYGNANYGAAIGSTPTQMGGSHGGMGGVGTTAYYASDVYDQFNFPLDLGASCGASVVTACNGGGSIRLAIGSTLTNNNIISANGQANVTYSGGAGGSILISAPTITGSAGAVIRANGGNGGGNGYGGGGGGRIAIYYTSINSPWVYNTIYNNVQAFGGTSGANAYQQGAAGTIYLEANSQTYGDLLVNNNGTTATNPTYLGTAQTIGTTSSALVAQTLTASLPNQVSENNVLTGFYVNPNTAQNATNKLSDDTIFAIAGSTPSFLTTASGDMTTIGSVGNTFKLYTVFDDLEIRGNASLVFNNGRIRVMSGDISSNNTTSFNLNGSITCDVIDVGPTVTYTQVSGSSTVTAKCSSNFSCP